MQFSESTGLVSFPENLSYFVLFARYLWV